MPRGMALGVRWSMPPERVLMRQEYLEDTLAMSLAGRAAEELFIGSVSTEVEPAPRRYAELIRRIRETGIPAVFAENISSPRRMERLAADAGVAVYTLYTDALGPPGSDGDTYCGMMRRNVLTIVHALGR